LSDANSVGVGDIIQPGNLIMPDIVGFADTIKILARAHHVIGSMKPRGGLRSVLRRATKYDTCCHTDRAAQKPGKSGLRAARTDCTWAKAMTKQS
jgi:hypothetical protein